MEGLPKALSIVFLVATMLSIGMKVTAADLLACLRDRGFMTRSLAVNFLAIPAVGLLLAAVIPMSTDVKVGFLLLAVAPGGLNAVQFTSKATQGALPYAAALVFVLSFLSVLVSPLLAAGVVPLETSLALPYGKIIAFLLLGVLGPLGIGAVVHRHWGRLAGKLAGPVAIVGTAAFMVTVVLLMGWRRQAMAAVSKAELAGMVIFILASMVIGLALGGPGRQRRRILATGSSMRNAALCLIIATSSFADRNVDAAVIAFSALMIPMNMAFTIYELVQSRRARRRQA